MVYVRLAQEWTDAAGAAYPAGAMVDVDAATLAGLEARGVVAEHAPSPSPKPAPTPGGEDDPEGGWPRPTEGGGEDDPDGGWPRPTS